MSEMKKLITLLILFFTSLNSHAAFQMFFVCDTSADQHPSLHQNMASILMRALVQGENFYLNVLRDYPDCRQHFEQVKNIKLLKESGMLIDIKDGISYYILPVGKFTTIGVVGR